jgi:predicted adenylyl cyclase CyaB
MASNVEIKARLMPQDVERVRRQALAFSSAPPERLEQTDTFFRSASGRLKLREFGDGTGELIAYDRPDQAGPKHSSYVRHRCTDPRALHEVLSRSLGVRGVVRKRREVIHVGQTRVHIDDVVGLGPFLELEVVLRDGQTLDEAEGIAGELMGVLKIEHHSLVDRAYIDLLEASAGLGRLDPF